MTNVNRPRIMIVGTGSGCGKTTLTCGLLKAMQNRGLVMSSFKCGPDYIDPMFHREIIGTKGGNLDLFLCDEPTVKHLFAENSKSTDFAIIEGVMGLYDGIGKTDECSSNHLSIVTDTPQVLVMSVKGMSLTAVSQLYGYINFKKNNIKGVILNQISERMYPFFKEMIEKELRIKVYGYLPTIEKASFESRHLGLITANEVEDIQAKLAMLAAVCAETLDIAGLIELGNSCKAFSFTPIKVPPVMTKKPVRIAVAKDNAFCFYYEDNLTLLKTLGADIVFFSPLNDKNLPENIDGIIFGGGYPEEYAGQLSANKAMLLDVKRCIADSTPVIAECGGFIYLCDTIANKQGEVFSMVGAISAASKMTDRLSRFGYIKLIAQVDNLLCRAGESINAHEFHYSDCTNNGESFKAVKPIGTSWDCIHTSNQFYAGYPHIHLWGNIEFAKNFIKECGK